MTRVPDNTLRLGEALRTARNWAADSELLCDFHTRWTLESPCLIVKSDPYAAQPAKVVVDGTTYEHVLQGPQIMEVCENASRQLGANPSDEQLLEAFLHYYDNDAFIAW